MRRRRSPRVVWLPQDTFASVDGAALGQSTIMRATLALPSSGTAGGSDTAVFPVVRDTSPNPLGAANTLADIELSGYRLRRLVGKIWCFADQASDPTGTSAIVCTAGFIVLRTLDQTGLPLNTVTADYQTASILNTQDPWIWRRSWFLRNLGAAAAANFAVPFTTVAGVPFGNDVDNTTIGGNADGAHIDQKTARVIGPEERLFLVLTVTGVDLPQDAQAGPLLVDWVWDLRVLASMRSSVGNRRNASR